MEFCPTSFTGRASATFRGQHPHAGGEFLKETGPSSWGNRLEMHRLMWDEKNAPNIDFAQPLQSVQPQDAFQGLSERSQAVQLAKVRQQQERMHAENRAKASHLHVRSAEAALRAEESRATQAEFEAQRAQRAMAEAEAKRASETRAARYERKYGIRIGGLAGLSRPGSTSAGSVPSSQRASSRLTPMGRNPTTKV